MACYFLMQKRVFDIVDHDIFIEKSRFIAAKNNLNHDKSGLSLTKNIF